MRHADRTIHSIADLVSALLEQHDDSQLRWFRGHASIDWKLIPNIARNPEHLKAELGAIKIFKQLSRPLLVSTPRTDWEWIFLMQHHAAPTRLLDWSENPLAALYFALHDQTDAHAADDAVIWVLDPVALNLHSGHRHQFPKDLLAFDIDGSLDAYLPENVNPALANLNPVAGIGPQNSIRMAAQSGTFTVIHSEATPIDQVGDSNQTWRLVIPSADKSVLRQELAVLKVRDFTFFPDLDRVAMRIKEMLA